jgi:hypothetical protein
MKNNKILTFGAFVIIGLSVSCKSSNENNNSTNDGVEQAESTAKPSDSLSDYAVLKAKTLDLVKTNDAEIAAFKAKLATETAENKVKFQKEIDTLNAKNARLKSTLNDYKEQGKVKLNSFKERLQKSIDDINKDIDTYKTEHK